MVATNVLISSELVASYSRMIQLGAFGLLAVQAPNTGVKVYMYGMPQLLNCDSKLVILVLDFRKKFKDKIFEVKQKASKSYPSKFSGYAVASYLNLLTNTCVL